MNERSELNEWSDFLGCGPILLATVLFSLLIFVISLFDKPREFHPVNSGPIPDLGVDPVTKPTRHLHYKPKEKECLSIYDKTFKFFLKDLKSFNNIRVNLKGKGMLTPLNYTGNYIFMLNTTPPDFSKLDNSDKHTILELLKKL